MKLRLALQHAWNILGNEDEGLYGFILWSSQRLWHWYWLHYIVNTLAIIGLISICLYVYKQYRKEKAFNLRLKRVEEQIMKEEK